MGLTERSITDSDSTTSNDSLSQQQEKTWRLPECWRNGDRPVLVLTATPESVQFRGSADSEICFEDSDILHIEAKVQQCWCGELIFLEIESYYRDFPFEPKKEELRLLLVEEIKPDIGDADIAIQLWKRESAENPSRYVRPHKIVKVSRQASCDLNLLNAIYCSTDDRVPDWVESALSDPDIDKQRSPRGNTVLHIATSRGNNWMVGMVAQYAPHLFSTRNENNDTALHVAAREGHASTIEQLLNYYFDIARKSINYYGEISLNNFTLELIVMLSLALFRNDQGNTFLHEAFEVSKQNGATIFEAFEDLSLRDPSQQFETEFPIRQFETEFKSIVVQLALSASNDKKNSLLYLAIKANRKDIVSRSMNIHSKHIPDTESLGNSPLVPPISKKDYDMQEIILDNKPSWVLLRDELGRIPIHYAASVGFLEGVSYLIKKCASCIMEKDIHGFFPLHLAAGRGHVEVVQELLKWCLDPTELLDEKGRNFVHIGAVTGKYKVVNYILQAQIPKVEKIINQRDKNENTPLHLATRNWRPRVVYDLTWDKRVKLGRLNAQHQTALDIFHQAADQKNPTLSQRLVFMALVSAGTPRSKMIVHSNATPKNAGDQHNGPSNANPNPNNNTARCQDNHSDTDSSHTSQGQDNSRPNANPNANTTGDKDKDSSNGAPDPAQFKDRVDTLIVTSTLIITASFSAALSVPGNVQNWKGDNLNYCLFRLLILCITVSMYGSLAAFLILMLARVGDLSLAYYAIKFTRKVLAVTLGFLSLAFVIAVPLVVSNLGGFVSIVLVIGEISILMVLLLYYLALPTASTSGIMRNIS